MHYLAMHMRASQGHFREAKTACFDLHVPSDRCDPSPRYPSARERMAQCQALEDAGLAELYLSSGDAETAAARLTSAGEVAAVARWLPATAGLSSK